MQRGRGAGMKKKATAMEEGSPSLPAGLVKVKREVIVACMTCPLCHKLFRDATTISECLHTFCRKCIYEKLIDEEVDCCPICKINLGCSPVEKLRPDHNLQDVRAKIFPLKRRKICAPEASPSVTLPIRRKERSLSSLVVNSTPRAATQSPSTGRRSKASSRRTEETNEEKPPGTSFTETPTKVPQSRGQSSCSTEHSSLTLTKEIENGGETATEKSEMWKPLNCLVEAANRTKSFKVNGQSSLASSSSKTEDETKLGTHLPKLEPQIDGNKCIDAIPPPAKPRRRRGSASREIKTETQALPESSGLNYEKRTNPIWFSLTAAADQEEYARLPQINSSFVRLKDRNLPVSFIQKYLAKKLNLASETEVEIKCRGQPVPPALALWELAGLWLQSGPTPGGAAAEDFVMALSYARKPISPST
ncbi:DREB2A-interacting protein 2 [Wolffia australiana]